MKAFTPLFADISLDLQVIVLKVLAVPVALKSARSTILKLINGIFRKPPAKIPVSCIHYQLMIKMETTPFGGITPS